VTEQEKKLIKHHAQDAIFFAEITQELIALRLDIMRLEAANEPKQPPQKNLESEGI